jgi:hypothetical protein
MSIDQSKEGEVSINQRFYVQELLERFDMVDCATSNVPYLSNLYTVTGAVNDADIYEPKRYKEMCGSLLYLVRTRPDIAFVMAYLCRFMARPTKECHAALKVVLRHLKGTSDYGCTYKRMNPEDYKLHCYVDSDYASDHTRKSFTGYMIFMGSHLVGWRCCQQPTVALSTCESEYVGCAFAAKEVKFFRNMLKELKMVQATTRIRCDNTGTIAWMQNPCKMNQRKHIDIKRMFLEDLQDDGEIKFSHVSSEYNLADLLTKPLPHATFKRLRDRFMGPNCSEQITSTSDCK